MVTYLVTGGAGFIGSNFVRYLYECKSDFNVIVLDKLTYSGNTDNLADFMNKSNFRFIRGDICNEDIVDSLVPLADVIINFAAEVSVDRSLNDNTSFIKTDILGVRVLLEAVRKSKKQIKRFIQISTDEVYGHILNGSFNELSPLRPRNPYAASKLGGERLAYSYYASYDLPVIVTRASNNYGAWAFPEKVIPLFITNLYDNMPVPIFGDGRQIRDWLYVVDHCKAIDILISDGKNGETYNIGANQEYTNLELTKKILKHMNKSEKFIKYVNDRPGHDFRYSLDSSKLEALGWQPQYTLDDGLESTIQWYLSNEDYWRPLKTKLGSKYARGLWGEGEKK